MKQVKHRTVLVALLVVLLAVGILLFCVEFFLEGSRWAAFPANDHAYTNGRLAVGQVLDRNGLLLYDAPSGTYAEDSVIREATLHTVGDPGDNISTSAKSALADHLLGYNRLTGTIAGGHRLYLTIDAQLNRVAYEALQGRKGAVGVYNYVTGDVLCMVSTPAFDPADPPEITTDNDAYEGVYLNRFLSAAMTPGSVFKVVTAAAAIEQIPDIFSRTFTCSGITEVGGGVVVCPYAHGEMDFYGTLANSCNCAYAQMAVEIGDETLQGYVQSAGLLSSQQVSGISTVPGSFTAGTADQLGWSAVGQYEDLVNPCSLLTLMGTIANNGTAPQPRLIARETGLGALPTLSALHTATLHTWSSSTCHILRQMMRNNVTETYGQDMFGDLAVCAKSGTADVSEDEAPHAWFAGFLDDPHNPLAFVVLVENGGGGAAVAGPVAAAVLQQAVQD